MLYGSHNGISIPQQCANRARKSVYFLSKTKMAAGRFLVFRRALLGCSVFALVARPPRGHSTVGIPMRCEGFVAIWLRAREDIADNRFQLLIKAIAKPAQDMKRCGNKMDAPEASVHPVRNRLCYHFFLYQTNESYSRIVSRRLMLLRSLNKSYFRITAPNATEAERPFYERSRIVLHVIR